MTRCRASLLVLAAAVASASAFVVTTPAPPPSSNHPRYRRIPSASHAASSSSSSSSSSSTALSMSQGRGRKSQSTTDEFLSFMNEPLPNLVDPNSVTGPPESDDLAPLVRTIASAADKRKAEDVVALRVSKVTAMTAFLVVVSGNSRPQNNAIAAAIIDDVSENHDGLKTRGDGGPEGTADSGWILLDYGDVMVHVMTPKSRLFYDVEGQWREKGGEEMNLSDVLLPDPMARDGVSSGGIEMEDVQEPAGTMEGLSEEEDPFWS